MYTIYYHIAVHSFVPVIVNDRHILLDVTHYVQVFGFTGFNIAKIIVYCTNTNLTFYILNWPLTASCWYLRKLYQTIAKKSN